MKRCRVAFALAVSVTNPAHADRLELGISDAHAIMMQDDMPAVEILFDEVGTRKIAEFTRDRVGKTAEFYIDEDLILSAVITDPILDGRMMVNNVPDAKGAILLAMLLRAGDRQFSAVDPE